MPARWRPPSSVAEQRVEERRIGQQHLAGEAVVVLGEQAALGCGEDLDGVGLAARARR